MVHLKMELYMAEKDGIYCQSKIFDTEEFGYQKIVVEQPPER